MTFTSFFGNSMTLEEAAKQRLARIEKTDGTEKDSRTLLDTVTCPYCSTMFPSMSNPLDFVNSTTMDYCEKCKKSFFVVLQWNSYTTEDMRKNYSKVHRKI